MSTDGNHGILAWNQVSHCIVWQDGGKEKRMRYKAVVFDLDGTLLNTLEDLTDAVNAALKKYDMPARTLKQVRGFVGNGIGKLMERAIPAGREDPAFEKVFREFREYYGRHCRDKTKPYPGVLPMLQELKNRNIKMAIVSNKADFAVKELREVYFRPFIDTAIGEREGLRRKPEPDMVYYALKELGCQASETVYVGDSDVDVLTAKNAGMACIGVSWGFRGREFLQEHGAETVMDTPDEILNLFC